MGLFEPVVPAIRGSHFEHRMNDSYAHVLFWAEGEVVTEAA